MTKIELLKKFNLSSQQAKLYLAALELSPTGASALAEKAGLERTASYPHLEELAKMGLLSIVPIKGKKEYVAEDPRVIGKILDEKKDIFKKGLPELMSSFNVRGIKPKIRYYEGRDGMKKITTNAIMSGSQEILDLTPVKNVMAVLGERFVKHRVDARVQKGIRLKVLRPKERIKGPWEMVSTDKSLLREIRYLPENFKLDNFITIYANTVAIVSSLEENYGLEIESKEFADTMRSLFYLVWEKAEKVTKSSKI
jgi:sugar-specific transcriptional regulator TrmB